MPDYDQILEALTQLLPRSLSDACATLAQRLVINWATLPTADPHVAGQPWLNNGVVTVSAGSLERTWRSATGGSQNLQGESFCDRPQSAYERVRVSL